MALEFFQYQVKVKWYRLYVAIILFVTTLIVAVHVAGLYVGFIRPYELMFGFDSLTTTVLAGATLVYVLGPYMLMIRKSLPFATLIAAMLFTLTLLSGLSYTDPSVGELAYVGLWCFITFYSGVYGVPILAGTIFLTYAYAGLLHHFNLAAFSKQTWLVLAGSTAMSVLSYFFWNRRFVSLEEQKVTQLSGMLRSNKEQSEILIQSVTDGIIVINTEGKITLINPAAAAMTQWAVSEALGVDVQLVAKLTKEDGSELDNREDPFKEVITEKQHINQTLVLHGRENKEQVISLSVSPLLSDQAKAAGAVAIMRDVSEEHAAEKQRGEFISTASHEMRTPVAAIEGYLALALNDKVSTIDTRARNYLEKAHASTEHLGKLFQDLLTSSRAEDGRLSNHPTVVEMGALMQQLSDDLKFGAEKKGLLAEFVIGGADETIDATSKDASLQHLVKPLYYVYVDPDRIREVITDLFDNACKYTDSGKISIGLTGNIDVVQLYIRDTGAGIPADDIPHLFQKFYRVDNSATRTIGGTGLGLFISRKIVELYHGRIWVESEVGKGSTFFINLPRLTTQRASELQSSEASNPIVTTGSAPPTATTPASRSTNMVQ